MPFPRVLPRSRISELENEVQRLLLLVASREAQLHGEEVRVIDLSERNTELVASIREQLREAEARIVELSDHNTELGDQLSHVLNESESIEQATAIVTQELRVEKAKSEGLVTEISMLRTSNGAMGITNSGQLQRLQEVEARNAELADEVLRCRMKETVWNEERKAITESHTTLQREITAQQDEMRRRETRVARLERERRRELGKNKELSLAMDGLKMGLLPDHLRALQTDRDALTVKVVAYETLISASIEAITPTQEWESVGNSSALEVIKVLRRHGLVTAASPPCLLLADQFLQVISDCLSRSIICRHIIVAFIFQNIFRPTVFGLEEGLSATVDRIEKKHLGGHFPCPPLLTVEQHRIHLRTYFSFLSLTRNVTISNLARQGHWGYIGDLENPFPSLRRLLRSCHSEDS
jgi:hypothetical protein